MILNTDVYHDELIRLISLISVPFLCVRSDLTNKKEFNIDMHLKQE